MLEIFSVSAVSVAIAEIGDKTQLLALLLVCRFKRPWPVIWGILFATVANHALAAWAGQLITQWVDPGIMRWFLGFSFIVMAAWTLIPDKLDDEEEVSNRFGPFLTTLTVFFFVEIGDKTQILTTMLGARYENLIVVTAGSTLGMMLANAPVVFAGNKIAERLPLHWIRRAAAALFAILGLLTLLPGTF